MLCRRDILVLLAGTAISLPSNTCNSQDGPDRPLRIVVPFPAGGSADLTARLLAEDIRNHHRQSVIVENKPGAGGNLAAAEVARSNPDGTSILIGTTGTYVFNQFIYRNPGFDAMKDFSPLGVLWSSPNICVIHCLSRTNICRIGQFRSRKSRYSKLRHLRGRRRNPSLWRTLPEDYPHCLGSSALSRPVGDHHHYIGHPSGVSDCARHSSTST